jgi:hypothetical protein
VLNHSGTLAAELAPIHSGMKAEAPALNHSTQTAVELAPNRWPS